MQLMAQTELAFKSTIHTEVNELFIPLSVELAITFNKHNTLL